MKAAGIVAVSSFLTAELVKTVGLSGFVGELGNTVAGTAIGQILTNLAALAQGGSAAQGVTIFKDVNPATIGNAVGSLVGAKLAALTTETCAFRPALNSMVASKIFLDM